MIRAAAACSILSLTLNFAVTAKAVVIDWVTVGNPGNAPDTSNDATGFGSVGYSYQIGKYEVTAGQYTEFLNAVAKDDPNGLYNTNMGEHRSARRNIQRTGSSPNYSYSVDADWANRPVNYVSFWDAARFANWLHNSQPTGRRSGNHRGRRVSRCRQPDAVWPQRRREILHSHRGRMVQGGLSQERRRDGQLLGLPDRERHRARSTHCPTRATTPTSSTLRNRQRRLHDRQPVLSYGSRRIRELREPLRHVRPGR